MVHPLTGAQISKKHKGITNLPCASIQLIQFELRCCIFCYILVIIVLIGASLSEPHTSVTAFAEVSVCVCMSACGHIL